MTEWKGWAVFKPGSRTYFAVGHLESDVTYLAVRNYPRKFRQPYWNTWLKVLVPAGYTLRPVTITIDEERESE